jgi:membrane-associated phospholipid phosphatase
MAMGAQGIITFPSLHAALALIITVALWPIPILRWVTIAINTLMLVSIPVDGGHYFIDVLAGLAIASASIVAAKRIAEFAHQPQLQTANSGVGLIPG